MFIIRSKKQKKQGFFFFLQLSAVNAIKQNNKWTNKTKHDILKPINKEHKQYLQLDRLDIIKVDKNMKNLQILLRIYNLKTKTNDKICKHLNKRNTIGLKPIYINTQT
ncbi:hypothetical protein TCON_2656 [Astathelohania contejeani]|uniref:Ribosomal protein S13 n=1 Tax=Astathelohania contejeani TaxID=164912 RepID=A0ABQ7HVD7_9MICR|nr:hypothetical protein TCON_2656 [Thelohania contejeani]